MFFYVAKVVWFIAQPSGLLLVCIAAAVVAVWTGRTRLARLPLGLALFIVLVALSPVSNIVLLPLEQRFARADLAGPPVTGILILGGAEDVETASNRKAHGLNEAAERFSEALELARRLPQARVVFTGGSAAIGGSRGGEAEVVRAMLTGMGLDGARLTIEDRSRDTYENAVFTKAMIGPKPGERWLMITSAWHMARSAGVFRKVGFKVEPWPVDYRTSGWQDARSFQDSPGIGLRRLDIAMKEYIGLIAYWLAGRTDSIFPAPCPPGPPCG